MEKDIRERIALKRYQIISTVLAEQIDRLLERGSCFERDCDDLFLFPPETGTDGGFGARLRRVR